MAHACPPCTGTCQQGKTCPARPEPDNWDSIWTGACWVAGFIASLAVVLAMFFTYFNS